MKYSKGGTATAVYGDRIDDVCTRLRYNDPSLTIASLHHQGIGTTGAIKLAKAQYDASCDCAMKKRPEIIIKKKQQQQTHRTQSVNSRRRRQQAPTTATTTSTPQYYEHEHESKDEEEETEEIDNDDDMIDDDDDDDMIDAEDTYYCDENHNQDRQHLTVLFLDGNDIGSTGIKALTDSWIKSANTLQQQQATKNCMNRLQQVSLSYNMIGDLGAMAIATALSTPHCCQYMTTLKLAGNGIGPRGAHAIAVALGGGCSTSSSGCSSNQLGVLLKNKKSDNKNASSTVSSSIALLRHLDLRDNHIGDVGANAMATIGSTPSSSSSSSVQVLDLRYNDIKDMRAVQSNFCSALKTHNKSLMELHLLEEEERDHDDNDDQDHVAMSFVDSSSGDDNDGCCCNNSEHTDDSIVEELHFYLDLNRNNNRTKNQK